MNCFIFISILVTLVQCRPQDSTPKPSIEIEKQTIIKLPNENEQSRQLTSEEEKQEANTKDILEKIAQVNLNHGLKQKIVRRPFYPTTHQVKSQNQDQTKESKQLPNFQFSNTPLGNPIFDYLQRNQNNNNNNIATKTAYTPEDENEEIPAGYSIKRKVTHQQTLFIPSFNYPQIPDAYQNSMLGSVPIQNQFDPTRGGNYGLVPISQINPNIPNEEVKLKNNTNQNKTLDELTLAKQNFLINNIKNIISNSQGVPAPSGYQYNPYAPYQINPYANTYQPYQMQYPYADPYANVRVNPVINPYNPYSSVQNYLAANPVPIQNPIPKLSDTFYANLQTAKDTDPSKSLGQDLPEASGRQFQGPFSQYFPIVIKNPFQQMFQAFTSMVEYGPDSNLCRNHLENKHNHDEVESKSSQLRSGKALEYKTDKPQIEIKDDDTNTEIVIQKLDETTEINNDNEFYIEGLKIISDKKATTKPKKSIQKKTEQLENRQMEETDEPEPEDSVLIEEDKFFSHHHHHASLHHQGVPTKEESTNSPSSGIFIQRLKVRKGGVAIAGPGGIATAGSGGTAIVGPGGYAYTQPNGIAIAGPGSRVISVDPSVNLSEFVENLMKNKTMARLGKLVAIGPIVYHDLGQK